MKRVLFFLLKKSSHPAQSLFCVFFLISFFQAPVSFFFESMEPMDVDQYDGGVEPMEIDNPQKLSKQKTTKQSNKFKGKQNNYKNYNNFEIY